MQHLDGVLGPQLRRVADNLRIAGLSTDGKDADSAAAELAASVGAMANLSKGFRFLVATEVEARFFQARTGAHGVCMDRFGQRNFFFPPSLKDLAFVFPRRFWRRLGIYVLFVMRTKPSR